LDGKIMLYRHGKDRRVALDKREAERDVFIAIIEYMTFNATNGSIQRVRIGDRWFEIRVTPEGEPAGKKTSGQTRDEGKT